MTREYAVELFNSEIKNFKRLDYSPKEAVQEYIDAMEMAIESLKQKPGDDCISRQAVDELSKALVHTTRDKADFLCNFWKGLQKLPPVNPQEPCSNCCNGNQIEQAKLCQKSYLAGMKHKQESKWIPVSERLPEEGKDVLACFYTGEGNYKMLVSHRSDYNYWSGVGRTADMVAWMPLPEPYRAESEE